ncbi:heterokaryon incompatibility protein-domain-containing protein, partial [Pisolithus marmoratus]
MKLLNVEVVLNREKGIQQAESEQDSRILKELDDGTTSYAILSHRWGLGVEVTYEEMIGFMTLEDWKRDEVQKRYGYQKIIKCCEQAMKDGYKWIWIDTCCIDKRSSAELSEAINAMYRWYQNAQVCYAYLNDVDGLVFPIERDDSKLNQSNGWPEWFMRGWTLQELIAPEQVEFFNKDWVPIGNKQRLAPTLQGITGIPRSVLTRGLTGKRLSVAQIMSWAAERKTERVEDRAYSLMGLFGVNMPMLYGEGKNAFRRLQLEIIKETSDHSIFAWDARMPRTDSVLAEDPSDFEDCGTLRITKVAPDDFGDKLVEYIDKSKLGKSQRFDLLGRSRRAHQRKLVALRDAARSQQFGTFTVSNTGIQVCLPVIPLPDSPSRFRAILPCTSLSGLATVDLVSSGSSFDRIATTDSTFLTYPEFKTLHLTHHQDVNEKRRKFSLDDKHASYYGFSRCGAHPHKFWGNAVTLSSLTDALVVIVYANSDTRSRFAVGLGYYRSQGWVHVVCDGHSPTKDHDWTRFGRSAYDQMWEGRIKHAQSMPKQEHDTHVHRDDHFTKHVHLPRSIWAARVVWGRWEMDNFKVMVDVEQCPGCCDEPCRWTVTDNDCGDVDMPGLMKTVPGPYLLGLDGWEARFDKWSGQLIELGDYGDYSDGVLTRTGSIFEDMRTLGIVSEDTTYSPVVSRVSGWEWRMHEIHNQDNVAVARSAIGDRHLALRQPKGISLPANDSTVLLLKALSIRLAGKHLVTTVIQCSEFYEVDKDGKRSDSGNDFVSDNVEPSIEAGMLTPLYTIATPQVWRRHLACAQRKERFKSIREHFYALVNMRRLAGTELHRKSVNKRKKDGAIKFFSDLFGLKYLRYY